jgi:hypothetical protein
MEPSNVHNLSLNLLDAEPDGSLCEVTVVAFDRTTTSNASKTIELYVRMMPEPEVEELPIDEPEIVEPEYSAEIAACSEAGGDWNPCGSACLDGDAICIQVCVPKCEFTDGPETTETSEDTEGEESGTELVL